MIRNMEWIKITNIKRAIDYACQMEYFSKREMAEALGVCFTTASKIVNMLENVSLLDEVPPPKNRENRALGRVTKWYRLLDTKLSFLVINFANTSLITIALVNLRHEVEAKIKFVIEKEEDWQDVIRKMQNTYRTLLEKTGQKDENVVAVGVSIQGSYNAAADILYGIVQPITHGRHIGADFKALFSKHVVIQNDIDMAAAYIARTISCNHLIYVYLDYQIGIGVINDGKVLSGANGLTTEIAHAPLGDSGRVCPGCGARNCLELSLGKGAFLEHCYGRKFPICANGYKREWADFMESVRKGEPRAMNTVIQKAELLTRMLVIVLTVTRSSTIMIGGICRELFEMLDSLLEKNMTEWKKQYSVDEILYDSNAERTILIGTMDAVYQKWYPDFESGQLWIDRGEAWSPS